VFGMLKTVGALSWNATPRLKTRRSCNKFEKPPTPHCQIVMPKIDPTRLTTARSGVQWGERRGNHEKLLNRDGHEARQAVRSALLRWHRFVRLDHG
jgi:hypothetical protein